MNGICDACGNMGELDRAHIRSKGAGGPDSPWNILFLHRECHILQHRLGFKRFSERFPRIVEELESKGWKFEKIFGVWKLVRK